MRLGTTSYIIPADILPNVEYLAPLVDDVELVLFEVDESGGNLPDEPTITRLAELAAAHDLTYTVHLPLDLRLAADGGEADASLVKARRVIARTASLRPWAYVVHLDGRDLAALGLRRWQDRARRSLELVAGWAGDPRLVSIENLEAWDPAAFAPLLDELPVSRCVDVGHLWFQGLDPLPALDAWLPRARVVHLHGVADRDHQSLAHVPDAELARVAAALEAGFDGVATIEVFSAEDLRGSLKAWQAAGGNPAPEGKSKPASAL